MNRIFASLALAATAALASTTASATTYHNYYICNTSGCSVAGNNRLNSTYAQTKYPVVLAHGMAGFSAIGPIDYFYLIPADLTYNGATVYVTQVASFNNISVRGPQLLTQVNTILALTGAAKVNLIGHSQGALDTRYVAAAIPSRIASEWTVGGVNKGDPVADVLSGIFAIPGIGTISQTVATTIINAFFTVVDVFSGSNYEQNSKAAMLQLTDAQMNAFNATYPQGVPTTSCGNGAASVNGVAYYSWSGSSQLTNILDLSDAALGLTSLAFMGHGNDGLVGQCQSHLGTVISDSMGENHLDEVNQILGLVNIFATDTQTVFRNNVNRMKNYGF